MARRNISRRALRQQHRAYRGRLPLIFFHSRPNSIWRPFTAFSSFHASISSHRKISIRQLLAYLILPVSLSTALAANNAAKAAYRQVNNGIGAAGGRPVWCIALWWR